MTPIKYNANAADKAATLARYYEALGITPEAPKAKQGLSLVAVAAMTFGAVFTVACVVMAMGII